MRKEFNSGVRINSLAASLTFRLGRTYSSNESVKEL